MERIKLELLKYLNRSSKLVYAATEVETVHAYKADVVTATEKSVYEYEIKSAVHDIIPGELRKVKKHKSYSTLKTIFSKTPNYFTLVIPEEYVESTLEQLSLLCDKYGILAYSVNTEGDNSIYSFRNVQSPHILHSKNPSILRKNIVKRLIADNIDLTNSTMMNDSNDILISKDRRIGFLERKLRDKEEELNQLKDGIFKNIPLIAKTNVYAEKVTIHYSDSKTKTFKIKD